MALCSQTQPELQLETAQQPGARVQKCHCSQLESRVRVPKPALEQAAAGCHDRNRQSDWEERASPRQESQVHRQEEATR